MLMHLCAWVVQRRGCLLPGSTGDLWRIPGAYQQSSGLIYKHVLCRCINFSEVIHCYETFAMKSGEEEQSIRFISRNVSYLGHVCTWKYKVC